MRPKPKLVLALFGAVLLAALLAVLIPAIQHRGKIPVDVRVSPKDAAVTLNGKPIKAGRVYLGKGTHEFKVTREHFHHLTKTVNTNDVSPNEIIALLPEPSTSEGEAMLQGDSKIQQDREVIGAAEAAQTQEALNKRYPFLGNLPYTTLEYKIDYALDKDKNLSLQVTLYPTGNPETSPKTYKKELGEFREEALNYLRTIGVNVNSTPITYTPNPDQ